MNRVLVVEDEPSVRLFLQECLSGAGFSVEVVETATGAYERLRSHPPDLLLLDLGLPGSSGLETVARVHAHAFATPIIVLTATGDEELGMACIHAGAQDFLEKTKLSPESLGRSLTYALARKADSVFLDLNVELGQLSTLVDDAQQSEPDPEVARLYEDYLSTKHISDMVASNQLASQLAQRGYSASQVLGLHTHTLRRLSREASERQVRYFLARGRFLGMAVLASLADAYQEAARGPERRLPSRDSISQRVTHRLQDVLKQLHSTNTRRPNAEPEPPL
ncbi:MAG: response regulator [Candidatus Eremiobacteraeota bacterium]|nr:response regulator [Candidatus Eremiobacteraeota bacterium]